MACKSNTYLDNLEKQVRKVQDSTLDEIIKNADALLSGIFKKKDKKMVNFCNSITSKVKSDKKEKKIDICAKKKTITDTTTCVTKPTTVSKIFAKKDAAKTDPTCATKQTTISNTVAKKDPAKTDTTCATKPATTSTSTAKTELPTRPSVITPASKTVSTTACAIDKKDSTLDKMCAEINKENESATKEKELPPGIKSARELMQAALREITKLRNNMTSLETEKKTKMQELFILKACIQKLQAGPRHWQIQKQIEIIERNAEWLEVQIKQLQRKIQRGSAAKTN